MPIGAKFREREYMARFQTDKVILPRLVDPNVLVAVAETSDLKASVGSDIKAPLNLTDTQSILHHLTDTYAIGEVISYFGLMMNPFDFLFSSQGTIGVVDFILDKGSFFPARSGHGLIGIKLCE
jgi:hypothetical protein